MPIVASLPNLVEVHFWSPEELPDDLYANIFSNRHLKIVNFNLCYSEKVSDCKSLEHLQVWEAVPIYTEEFAALQSLSKLKSLDVALQGVSLQHFKRGLKNKTELKDLKAVFHYPIASSNFLKEIRKNCANLTKLVFVVSAKQEEKEIKTSFAIKTILQRCQKLDFVFIYMTSSNLTFGDDFCEDFSVQQTPYSLGGFGFEFKRKNGFL